MCVFLIRLRAILSGFFIYWMLTPIKNGKPFVRKKIVAESVTRAAKERTGEAIASD